MRKGNYDKSLEYREKALKIKLSVFGENHPAVASCYSDIGGIYKDQGNYDKSLAYYDKSLKIMLSVFGENHPYIPVVRKNIEEVKQKIGK